MASGKKGKKTKGKTLALTDFLQETTGSLPTQPIRKSTTNWADEVDDFDAVDSKIVNVVLPTAPKASRDYEDIENKVPKDPPFIAYLSNLPYDIEEDEIAEFFKNLKIVSMRIPKGEGPKQKGFGYVEFEDRDSFMSALIIPDTNLKNRRIRIEVADNFENDRRRGGRMGDRMGGADTGGDWRSSNRPEPMEDRRGGVGGFSRDRDGGGFNRERDGGGGITREGMRDANRERDERGYGGFNRDREGGGFNRDREGGGFNRDREGGGFNRDRDFGRDRDSGFSRNRDQDDRPGAWRDGERSNFNDRGYSRGNYRDSERTNRYEDREERRGVGFRRHDDNERNGGLTRSSNRGDRDDRDSEAPGSESRQRPKLNLAPRTKPLEQSSVKPEPAVPSASIFGSAKPVDTTEREREIEERILKEQEERLTEPSRDKDREAGEESGERANIERGRPAARAENRNRVTTDGDEDGNNRDRGPPSRERRNASGDDNRRSGPPRSDYKSPDQKKKVEKQEKPKREEKRDRPEKEREMPKLAEPEVPNFQGSNKFALLDDAED